jgi:hypothetical protein
MVGVSVLTAVSLFGFRSHLFNIHAMRMDRAQRLLEPHEHLRWKPQTCALVEFLRKAGVEPAENDKWKEITHIE